jgi:hypothetical protein
MNFDLGHSANWFSFLAIVTILLDLASIIVCASTEIQVQRQLFYDSSLFYYANHSQLLRDQLDILTQDRTCGKYATVEVLGKSTLGEEIVAIRLRPLQRDAGTNGRDVNTPPKPPKVKILGNLHGDEPTGRVLTVALAKWLCDNVGKDDRATRILNKVELWLVPTVNPDGFALKRRGNANNVDLNRDFPDRFAEGSLSNWLPVRGDEQQETKVIMDWIQQRGPFVSSLAIHEGALVANYPWDGSPDRSHTYQECPDDKTFVHLSTNYAERHRKMALSSNPEFADKSGITNGAEWYPIYGSMQDWNYIVASCLELTLEVSPSKWPEEPSLPELFEDNRESMIDFILRSSLDGFTGIVYGIYINNRKAGKQNLPIPATVRVQPSFVNTTTDPMTGVFYRPLAPGMYDVEVEAVGFKPKRMQIEIPENGGLFQRIYLNSQPSAVLDADKRMQWKSDVIIIVGAGMASGTLYWIHLLLVGRQTGRSLMKILRR